MPITEENDLDLQPLPTVPENSEQPDEDENTPMVSRVRLSVGSVRPAHRGKLLALNWLKDISGTSDCSAVEVMFKNTRIGFYSNPYRLNLKIGDIVAVEAAPGHDIGRVTMIGRLVKSQMKKNNVSPDADLKKIFRLASQNDLEKFEEARAREHDTMIRSRKIAEELNLNMKIGDVEYQGDGGKAIFYYIADERIDFRKLIRILADTFKIRVEMKQIGARQEAGRIGGIGPCGRPLCCSTWMTQFISVGTGAARMQELSMNPQKLAGQCAKLKCCLNFEVDSYSEAKRKLPSRDIVLQTKDSDYYYFKPDILAGKITYSTDKSMAANLVTIDFSRAFEIIALNKQGIKVDTLQREEDAEPVQTEYVELVGQDSLTRFDKSKKKKKKKKAEPQKAVAPQSPRRKEPAPKRENQPKEPQPKKEQLPAKDNALKRESQRRRDDQAPVKKNYGPPAKKDDNDLRKAHPKNRPPRPPKGQTDQQ